MKFFDLFCGVGGFRLGMERNGNVCIGSCEIDKYARQTYAKNFGHEPEFRDARDIDPTKLPEFQCLCAGFPCQSFSLAGARRGFEDTRGTLFFEIVRIAREKQPSLLFLENVKGLLSHDKGQTFKIMLQTLDELGYDCEWQLVNSKYFVPQNRERIFIIGHFRGSGRQKILPIGEVGKRNDKSCKQTQTERKWVRSTHTRTIDANYWKGGSHGSMIAEPKIKRVKGKPNVYNTDAQAGKVYDIDGISPSVTGQRVNSQGFIAEPKKTTMIMNSNTNANIKNRIQDRDKTWTLTCNSNDFSIMDNFKIRKLTPTECERLQGFPDGWTKGVSDTQRYRQMGNAITVDVIQYIASFFKTD